MNDNMTDEEYLRRHRGTLMVNAAPDAASGGTMRDATDAELLAQRRKSLRADPKRMNVAELQAEIGYLQSLLLRKVCGDPMVSVTVVLGEHAPQRAIAAQPEREDR